MKPVQEQGQEQQHEQPSSEQSDHMMLRLHRRSETATSTGSGLGKFPKLTTTLRAATLATMLAGDDMTGAERLFSAGSTKLATVMRALTRRYRWPIERREFATQTADGQVAWVSMYTLPAAAIASAFELGAAAWIEEVRAARSRRLSAPTRRRASLALESNTTESA